MKSALIAASAVLLLLMPMALTAQPNGILGDWLDPTGSVIRIDRCGAEVCLWIAARGPTAPSAFDIHNPDAGQRSRALCGLEIGSSFALRDPDHAGGGMLYDPKTGKTYHGNMTADGDRLNLRGYVGIPLFGASQTWTRYTGTIEPCKAGH